VLKVGLTGGIGSGKSAVARLLAEHGAAIIDADVLAREVVAPGTPGLAEIVAAFGDEVLLHDGSLDRPALGRIVFADPEQRRRLEKITHPLIGEETFRRMDALSDHAVVVHDVPLLAEGRMEGLYDCVLVVEAPREVRLARLEKRGLAREEAEGRMATQATDEQRRAIATYVLDNSGSLDDLRRQVDEVWVKLTS
jgi:dephospho-CoA kinase